MDASELWRTFGVHLARLYGSASSLVEEHGESWFAVLTGEQHPDLNQCALSRDASPADANRLLTLIAEVDVPAVVSASSAGDEAIADLLTRAGMMPAPLPEPLMWCETAIGVVESSFDVRRVEREHELQTAIRLCAEGHRIDRSTVGRLLSRDVSREVGVTTWIAWDRAEPISVVWLTHGDQIGVWEMMTPPQHRRRGAARSVLIAALAECWERTTVGAFLWATPAGRPLYESLGFRALDEPTVWVTAGHEEAAIAIGQPG